MRQKSLLYLNITTKMFSVFKLPRQKIVILDNNLKI